MPPQDPWLHRTELAPSEQHHRRHLREWRRRRAETGHYRRLRVSISVVLHVLADRIAP
jgi:hypothetical protein